MDRNLADARAPFGDGYGPLLQGYYAPVFDEVELRPQVVAGAVPKDLNGVYLRTGPNPKFAPLGRYHPFDGDGMIHAAEFRNGTVTYRNRFVRTDALAAEERAGAATHYGIRETLKGRPGKPMKDSANTDMVGHAGKALALWYMAGDAYVIDPVTLHTLGTSAAIRATGGKISAHAKVDEITGELMFFDYFNDPPYMTYGVVDAKGHLIHHVPVPLPGPRLPHDMAVTERHSILHDLPLFHDEEAMALGRHKLKFHPELPTRFGVIPRHGRSEDLRWFEFSPCFIYHVVNAWDDGDSVVMVGCRFMPTLGADGAIDAITTARNIAELRMRARLWRWEMNLKTGAASERPLYTEFNVEFPGYDGRRTGRRTRWGYLVDHHPDLMQWSGLRKFDLETGDCVAAWSDDPAMSHYSEPWFAAADGGAAEDDGYVIAFHWHDGRKQQELQVFDARRLGDGPIARLRLPRPVPYGFHGCWIDARRIA